MALHGYSTCHPKQTALFPFNVTSIAPIVVQLDLPVFGLKKMLMSHFLCCNTQSTILLQQAKKPLQQVDRELKCALPRID